MKYKDVIDPDICQIINNKHVDNLKNRLIEFSYWRICYRH